MIDFNEEQKFYVFAERPNQGWRLAHGNLPDEAAAFSFAETLRSEGFRARITRRDTSVLFSD